MEHEGVAPPEWEPAILEVKKTGGVKNPWALAWWLKKHGMGPSALALRKASDFLAALPVELQVAMDGNMSKPIALVLSPYEYGLRTARFLLENNSIASSSSAGYQELKGGFSCKTCSYLVPGHTDIGTCRLIDGAVNVFHGICKMWEPNPDMVIDDDEAT